MVTHYSKNDLTCMKCYLSRSRNVMVGTRGKGRKTKYTLDDKFSKDYFDALFHNNISSN